MPFMKKEKPTDSALPGVGLDPPKAHTLKACQLAYRKARESVEAFAAQLDQARLDVARITTESVADENLDIAAVSHAMTQGEEKIRALEGTLRVATRRMEVAEANLKRADMQVKLEAEAQALAQLRDVVGGG